MRLPILLLVLAAAVPPAFGSTPPKRIISVSPPRQFVTVPVQIRGAHWRRCAARIRVSVRLPPGTTTAIGRPRLDANGSFRTSWRPPRRLAGHTVRVRATEMCGTTLLSASAPLQVLPTP